MEDYELFLSCHMLRVEEGSKGEEKKYKEVKVGVKMDETPAHIPSVKIVNLGDKANPKNIFVGDNWKGVLPKLCVRRIPLIQRAVPVQKQPYRINKNRATRVRKQVRRHGKPERKII
jgi:hypothetical protein